MFFALKIVKNAPPPIRFLWIKYYICSALASSLFEVLIPLLTGNKTACEEQYQPIGNWTGYNKPLLSIWNMSSVSNDGSLNVN